MEPLASWRHTAILVALFVALAAVGAIFQGAPGGGAKAPAASGAEASPAAAHPRLAPLYLSLIAAEWGLCLYVLRGSRRPGGSRLRDLAMGSGWTPRRIASDILLALALWGGWSVVQTAWTRLSGPDASGAVAGLLPRRLEEIALWVALSISAGIAEEIVFRGYFQAQFEALTGRRWVALLMQAALFGVAHGYQGFEACSKIALYGLLFGAVAMWRKSLRPGIIAHAWTDIAAGLLGA